ncbi:hypothetical protein S7711_10805 [Stachybotrys chartarum IBT 7711]|uniref:Uncharacterized protein n=1 Tax=Stachybotrys chartarum (strain CBS 109288 / IBT 7711) TaxID=1280523 RepID=A0A084AR55_STACB|nr:hypothetical protein S7711_10805 [Stachybotrys chartarum IBT 7711]KFA71591.1 hypothetical protein S40288_11371 [Stachybotrys chartarum IBT 40288]
MSKPMPRRKGPDGFGWMRLAEASSYLSTLVDDDSRAMKALLHYRALMAAAQRSEVVADPVAEVKARASHITMSGVPCKDADIA